MKNFIIEIQADGRKPVVVKANEFTIKVFHRDNRRHYMKVAIISRGGAASTEGVTEIMVESPLVAESRFYVFGNSGGK